MLQGMTPMEVKSSESSYVMEFGMDALVKAKLILLLHSIYIYFLFFNYL